MKKKLKKDEYRFILFRKGTMEVDTYYFTGKDSFDKTLEEE